MLPKSGKNAASELVNLLRSNGSDRIIVLHQDSEDFLQNANFKKGINYRMHDYDSTSKEEENLDCKEDDEENMRHFIK